MDSTRKLLSKGEIEDGWRLYLKWLTWVWSGEVDQVIEAMKLLAAARLAPMTKGSSHDSENARQRASWDAYAVG